MAVINPSRFEGWSSSVEEAKSMGKTVILSNIGTHIEQDPVNGYYFEPGDYFKLAEILVQVWNTPDNLSRAEQEKVAMEALHERTITFGKDYFRILTS